MRRKPFLYLLILLVLAALLLTPFIGGRPTHAQGGTTPDCNGGLICDVRNAFQALIDSYIGDLKAWAMLQLNYLFYSAIYDGLHKITVAFWDVVKAFIDVGVAIAKLSSWMSDNLFQPLLTATNQISGSTIRAIFVIALGILGCTYLLSSLVRFRVVNARNAITWFFVAGAFFQMAPAFYNWIGQLRSSINSYFYAASMDAMSSQSPFAKMAGDAVDSTNNYQMSALCNNFSKYISAGALTINGMDISLAYLKADGYDIFWEGNPCLGGGDPTDIPRSWYDNGGYFDAASAPAVWLGPITTSDGGTCVGTCDSQDEVDAKTARMQAATSAAMVGVFKLINCFPIVVFGIVEQLVSLCLVIAFGLTFISFSVALLFAFFERTEPITWAVLDQIIALVVQSLIIAILQSMVLALYISAANTASGIITLAVGVVGSIIMGILMWSGITAIWNSFNRLFEAFGQATGGAIISTGQATQVVVGTAASAAGAAVTGGAALAGGVVGGATALASGAGALAGGATYGQAAGLMFGGSKALDGAAFTLARLPGFQDTSLGALANQYMEGSATRRVGESLLGPVGGALISPMLLTDRNPNHDEAYVGTDGNTRWRPSMLAPSVNSMMGQFLSSPAWDSQEMPQIGRGGIPLRGLLDGEAGVPVRRGDLHKEMNDPFNGQGDITFTPAKSGTPVPISLNNDGNLDETLNEDFKRDLAADRQADPDRGKNNSNVADGQRLETAAAKIEMAGEALTRSADGLGRSVSAAMVQQRMEQVEGRMRVTGSNNVAEVMGDSIDTLRKDHRTQADNKAVAAAMAGAMDITPVERDGKLVTPVENKLPRFQMFADQALQMGLQGDEAKQIIREVKSNPEGALTPETRDTLIRHQHDKRGQSWQDSLNSVRGIEHAAKMLPGEISAYGMRSIPMEPATVFGTGVADPMVFSQGVANPTVFSSVQGQTVSRSADSGAPFGAAPLADPHLNQSADTQSISKPDSRTGFSETGATAGAGGFAPVVPPSIGASSNPNIEAPASGNIITGTGPSTPSVEPGTPVIQVNLSAPEIPSVANVQKQFASKTPEGPSTPEDNKVSAALDSSNLGSDSTMPSFDADTPRKPAEAIDPSAIQPQPASTNAEIPQPGQSTTPASGSESGSEKSTNQGKDNNRV